MHTSHTNTYHTHIVSDFLLYSHHWLVYDKLIGGNGYDMGCGGHDNFVSNVYGAGGEMRGIDYAYPDGYGYISKSGKQHWSANIYRSCCGWSP